MTTAKEIWTRLSSIDVSGKTEKKGNLTYLSWAWAWGVLMDNFPQSSYRFEDDTHFDDGTVMVHVVVTVEGISHSMWLPVLNYKNAPIQNPSAWDINTTRMRCLTKCLAMFGLGHYIYAGEDLPEATKAENDIKKRLFASFKEAIKDNNAFLMFQVAEHMNDEWWAASVNSFKDNKTEQKNNVDRLLTEGRAIWSKLVQEYKEHKANDDELGMKELIEDLPEYWQNRLLEVAG